MTSASTESGGGVLRGASGTLPLVDLLQVWSQNRFSGLVAVSARDATGRLYFVEGDIIHAEAGGVEGEPAVRSIVSWPDVSLEAFANTSTLKRTIKKRVGHLLLDAHREIDEARRTPVPAAPPPAPARPPGTAGPVSGQAGRPSLLDQLKSIPGVARLVRFGADGQPTGAGAAEPGAEALAARGLYLALNHAAAIGQAFGLGQLGFAALQGAQESMVVIHAGGQYVCLAVEPGASTGPIVERARALLMQRAPRQS